MNRLRRTCALLLLSAVSSLSLAQIATDETPYLERELLVMFDMDVQPEKVLMELADYHRLEVLSIPSPSTGIYQLYVHDEDWERALTTLRRHRHVRAVQLNHVVQPRETVPNDPNFGQQWHHVQSGDHDIDSDLAWDVTTGGNAGNGARIVVAVLEGGGSNYNHVDLIDNHWTNPGEIPDNGIDDDNNGYVDDYNGWNVGGNNDNIGSGGHGTSVSGMIGATGDNGTGGVGVNWDVEIMQVDMAFGLSESNVIAAYEYPKTMRDIYNATDGISGAFVVATNASWGIDQANPANYPLWCAYYDELGASGILNCGATTNAALNVDVVGDMPTACGSDYMVSVTATNSNDVRTFSGYGVTTIDLGAPGEQVYLPSGTNGYGNTSGTSFASPCVAGAIGLVYSVPCPDLAALSIANPQGAADLVLGYIYEGVDLVPNLVTEVATGGRLNVNNSVNLALAGCGPIECTIDSFSVTPVCTYDAASDSVITQAILNANFSNFLCEAEIICLKTAESDTWTCGLTEVWNVELSNSSSAVLDDLAPNTEYEVFFFLETFSSDTLTFSTLACDSLVPGCTDPDAINFDAGATIDDGGCEFPCTEVQFTLTTDCWPEEVGWSLVTESGETVVEITSNTYQGEGEEEVWSGCVTNGCHTLTITDEYGDGMYGSQWPGCEIDGNYALTTPEGAVIFAMEDPDYGDEVAYNFCLPAVPGCTEVGACNYNEEANADDGTCFSIGDACDDGDEETVLDAYNTDCLCAGVPAVPGCIDDAACNFDTAANVDDGSCFYVAIGSIAGAATATDMTIETYTYDGSPINDYEWSVSGGTIQGAASGVGLLSVDVMWEATGSGTVTVTETDTTGCEGDVILQVNLLVNNVSEWEEAGFAFFPNPAVDRMWIIQHVAESRVLSVDLIDASGRLVESYPWSGTQLTLSIEPMPSGVYSLRINRENEWPLLTQVILH